MKLMIKLRLFLLLILTGCALGDRSSVRIVSLKLPASAEVGKIESLLSQTQDALQIVDVILIINGLKQTPTPPAGHSDAAIRHYQGPPTRGCSISIRDGRLLIVFLEFGERNSSAPVKRICGSLEEGLKKQYGSERVRVESHY